MKGQGHSRCSTNTDFTWNKMSGMVKKQSLSAGLGPRIWKIPFPPPPFCPAFWVCNEEVPHCPTVRQMQENRLFSAGFWVTGRVVPVNQLTPPPLLPFVNPPLPILLPGWPGTYFLQSNWRLPRFSELLLTFLSECGRTQQEWGHPCLVGLSPEGIQIIILLIHHPWS